MRLEGVLGNEMIILAIFCIVQISIMLVSSILTRKVCLPESADHQETSEKYIC